MANIHNNRVIGVKIISESTTEPVTLEEVKKYIRKDFPDDDALLDETLIPAARKRLEKLTGCSIVTKTITAVLELINRQELPYGPVHEITDADNYSIIGEVFPRVEGEGKITITYTAGYGDDLPEDLKTAIMAMVLSMDENRGDDDKAHYSQIAKSLAAPFRRVLWV